MVSGALLSYRNSRLTPLGSVTVFQNDSFVLLHGAPLCRQGSTYLFLRPQATLWLWFCLLHSCATFEESAFMRRYRLLFFPQEERQSEQEAIK